MNEKIASEIQTEQRRGREKYGRGPDDLSHNDSHGNSDWHGFIDDQNHKAQFLCSPSERRSRLIAIAGLAVSAVESFDRQQDARKGETGNIGVPQKKGRRSRTVGGMIDSK